MQANLADRKAKLEITLARVIGQAVEITVRGLNAFTLSTAGNSAATLENARAFFGPACHDWQTHHSADLDETFAYFDLIQP